MPQPAPFAVIFDMDGVLVDSEPLTMRAYAQAAAEFGVRLDPEQFAQRVVVAGELVRDFYLASGGRGEDWDRVFARKTQVYRRLVQQELQVMPGARELLEELRAGGVPLALATAASRVTMEVVCGELGLAAYFADAVALEDVARQKPDPEAFLRAAGLLGMPPARCVVIEDAPKGLVAARAAGMRCVVIPGRLCQEQDWGGADLVVRSLEELTRARLAALVGAG